VPATLRALAMANSCGIVPRLMLSPGAIDWDVPIRLNNDEMFALCRTVGITL